MDIKELRAEIDRVDAELLRLFCRRMELSKNVALWKKEQGYPIFDSLREEEKLSSVAAKTEENMGEYARELWKKLMDLSKDYQKSLIDSGEVV